MSKGPRLEPVRDHRPLGAAANKRARIRNENLLLREFGAFSHYYVHWKKTSEEQEEQGAMRSDSVIIFGASVLVTAAVIASAHYFGNRSAAASVSEDFEAARQSTPTLDQAIANPGVSAETPSARTDQIIECHDPEIGKFYTNSATCEGADLENRLSDAQTFRASPFRPQFKRAGSAGSSRQAQSTGRSKPNLRLTGRSPPSGLPPECKFPVGKALEIERPLSAASDPYQSIWRVDYCRWRCEAMREGCPVRRDVFSYDYGRMCRDTEYYFCPFRVSSNE